MSFNRLNYDTCAYKHNLAETVGPGEYQLKTPPISFRRASERTGVRFVDF